MAVLKGIDVSNHNGKINWSQVKADGIQFAILRLGYGSDIIKQDDSQFEANVAGCEANGIPWGAYLYSYATNHSQAKSEAKHICRLLKGKHPIYPIYIDMEDADGYKAKRKVSSKMCVDICDIVCKAIERKGYYAGVYASKSWFDNQLHDSRLGRYDKWLAQWNNKPTYNGQFGVWQFTSSGNVNGINGRVDMNQTTGYRDYPAYIKEYGLNNNKKDGTSSPEHNNPSPAPAPSPAPTPVSNFKVGEIVHLIGSKIYYYNSNTEIPTFIKNSDLYVRQVGNGKVLISTQRTGNVTGWVHTSDIKTNNSSLVFTSNSGATPKIEWDYQYDSKIKELQEILNVKGYRIKIDGIAGNGTYNTVKKYTIELNDRGSLIKWVQERLSAMGFDCGYVDGIAGQATMRGIKAFQKAYKLGEGYLGGTDWYYVIR